MVFLVAVAVVAVQHLICFYIMTATIKFNYNFHVAPFRDAVGHLPQPQHIAPGNLVDFDINHPVI